MIGNTYINNTLDHSESLIVNGEKKKLVDSPLVRVYLPLNKNSIDIPVILDIRDVYADTNVTNGTIYVYYTDSSGILNTMGPFEVKDSTATITLTNATLDRYLGNELTLNYTSDKHYMNKTYKFVVDKIQPVMNATSNKTVFIGDNVTVSGYVTDVFLEKFDGSVDIIVYGNTINVPLVNGYYNYTFKSQILGTNNIIVSVKELNIGEETVSDLEDRFKYLTAATKTDVTGFLLNIEGNKTVLLGDNVTITGYLTDLYNYEYTGTVNLTINGEKLETPVEVINGSYNYTFTAEVPGVNNITISLDNGFITVASLDDEGNVIEEDDAVIEVNNDHTTMLSSYGNPFDGAVNITVEGYFNDINGNPYTGKVKLYFNDSEGVEVRVLDGRLETTTFNNIFANPTNMGIVVEDNDAIYYAEFTAISRRIRTVAIDGSRDIFSDIHANTTVDVSNLTISVTANETVYLKDTVTINGTVTDNLGNNFTGKVKITYDGKEIETDVVNGVFINTTVAEMLGNRTVNVTIIEGDLPYNFTDTKVNNVYGIVIDNPYSEYGPVNLTIIDTKFKNEDGSPYVGIVKIRNSTGDIVGQFELTENDKGVYHGDVLDISADTITFVSVSGEGIDFEGYMTINGLTPDTKTVTVTKTIIGNNEYQINGKVNVTINATFNNTDGTPYASRTVYVQNGSGAVIRTLTTDENGKINVYIIDQDFDKIVIVPELDLVTFRADVNVTGYKNLSTVHDIYNNFVLDNPYNEDNVNVTVNATFKYDDGTPYTGVVNLSNEYGLTIDTITVTNTDGTYYGTMDNILSDRIMLIPDVPEGVTVLFEGTINITKEGVDTSNTTLSNNAKYINATNPYDEGPVNVTVNATFTHSNGTAYTGVVYLKDTAGNVLLETNADNGVLNGYFTDINARDIILVPESDVSYTGKITFDGLTKDDSTEEIYGKYEIENPFHENDKVNVTVDATFIYDKDNTPYNGHVDILNSTGDKVGGFDVVSENGAYNGVIEVNADHIILVPTPTEGTVSFLGTVSVTGTDNGTYHVDGTKDNVKTISADTNVLVVVNTTVTLNATNTTINGTSTITINVTYDDLDGNIQPVKGGIVELTFTDSVGSEVSVVNATVENGIATYPYPAVNTTVGKNVTVKARYLENNTLGYRASEVNETNFTVAKINTTIDIEPINVVAHNTSSVNITIWNCTADGSGNKHVNINGEFTDAELHEMIAVTQDGVVLDFTISRDDDGNAIVSFVPNNGSDVNITVIYDGSEVYNGSSNSRNVSVSELATNLVINSTNTTINGTSTITVNVTDDNDKAVVGGVVELTITDTKGNTATVQVPVNEEGIATYTYEAINTTVGKDVTVQGKYLENATLGYKASEVNETKFTVAKINTTISIDAGSPVAHNETVATIVLSNLTVGSEDVDSNVAGESLVITVVQDGNKLPVTVVNDKTTDEGVITIKYTPITGSPVNITAEFRETDVYNPSENSNKTDVTNITTNMTVSVDDTVINGTTTVVIDLSDVNGKAVANGTIKLVFSDGTVLDYVVVGADNVNTTFNVPFDNTQVGKNVTVNVTFVPKDNSGYVGTSVNDTKFEVAKLNTTVIIIPSDNIVAHNVSTVNINLTNNTENGLVGGANLIGEKLNVTVVQNGTELNVTNVTVDDEGNAIVSFIPLNTLPITVSATYNGSEVYNGKDDEKVIATSDIKYIDTTVDVVAADTIINGTSLINVTVNDANGNPVNGTVQLTFNDTQQNTFTVDIQITDGKGNYTYPSTNTAVGKDVTVKAQYLANETYGYNASDVESYDFNVAKVNTTVEIVSGNPVAHNATNATVTLHNKTKNDAVDKTVPGETVHVTIKDANNHILYDDDDVTTGSDGTVNVTYTPVDGSEINFTVTYPGNDEVYNGNSSSIKDTPSKIGTTLVLNSTDSKVNGTSYVEINVTDTNGNPVNGTVRLVFNDSEGNAASVDVQVTNGIAIYNYTDTLVGKNVTVKGQYLENDTLGYEASAEEENDFNVAKINTNTTITPINVVAHNSSTARINLVNETKNDLIGQKLDVKVVQDGKDLNVTGGEIDEEGNAIVTFIPENTQPITITATYDGNKVYNGSDDETVITDIGYIGTHIELTSENTTINNTSEIKVTVLDDNNNPVNGTVNLTFKVNGNEEYSVLVPVTEGIAYYTYNSTDMAKAIDVTGYYVNNETGGYSQSPEITDQFEVAKINTTIDIDAVNVVAHNTSTVKVTLWNCTADGSGNKDMTLKNEDLIITVTQDGVVLDSTKTFDADGNTIVTFIPNNGSDVNITATYQGNEYVYNGNTSSKNVTVNEIDTHIVVNATNTTINGTSIVTVNVTDTNGNPVVGGIVELTITDTLYNMNQFNIPITDGIGSFEYPTDDINGELSTSIGKNVTVRAKYLENSTLGYAGSHENKTGFEVTKINTTITIDVGNPVFHNSTNASITLWNYTIGTTDIASPIPYEWINVNITQTSPVTGETVWLVEDEFVQVDANGNVNVTYKAVWGTDIYINASYGGSGAYNGSFNTTNHYPTEMNTSVILEANDTIINGTSTINIKVLDLNDLHEHVNGTVNLTFKVGDTEEYSVLVPVVNGTATHNYTNTEIGKDVKVYGYYAMLST